MLTSEGVPTPTHARRTPALSKSGFAESSLCTCTIAQPGGQAQCRLTARAHTLTWGAVSAHLGLLPAEGSAVVPQQRQHSGALHHLRGLDFLPFCAHDSGALAFPGLHGLQVTCITCTEGTLSISVADVRHQPSASSAAPKALVAMRLAASWSDPAPLVRPSRSGARATCAPGLLLPSCAGTLQSPHLISPLPCSIVICTHQAAEQSAGWHNFILPWI